MRFPALIFSLLVALLCAVPAQAAVTVKKSIWGPTTVNGQSAFPIYADLGAGIYQMSLSWEAIAPTPPKHPTDPNDPAYVWPPSVDYAISEARKYGIRVALQISFSPYWANGKAYRTYSPPPNRYADFITAAARRWPAVRYWMIWGEPSRRENFLPNPYLGDAQAPTRPSPHLTIGARRYARILDDAYVALKRVRRSNIVIGGNTYNGGDVGTLNWIRWLKLPNGRTPRMDMWGHNPFTTREPRLSRGLIAPGLADFSDLDTLAQWLDRYVTPRGRGKRLKLFLSEFQLPTDHANYEFNFYVTRDTQARFLRSAMRIVRGWKRIYTLGYHALLDEPPNGRGDEVARGLMDYLGNPKPGYYAFKNG